MGGGCAGRPEVNVLHANTVASEESYSSHLQRPHRWGGLVRGAAGGVEEPEEEEQRGYGPEEVEADHRGALRSVCYTRLSSTELSILPDAKRAGNSPSPLVNGALIRRGKKRYP